MKNSISSAVIFCF